MSFYIKGETRPLIGKNVYKLMSTIDPNAKKTQKADPPKIVKQRWTLYKRGKRFFDLGNDGGITFNQASLGVAYTIEVIFTDAFGVSGMRLSKLFLLQENLVFKTLNGRINIMKI